MGKMSGIWKKMNKTSGFKTEKTVLDGIFLPLFSFLEPFFSFWNEV